MNFVLKPSLEHIALVKIVVSLWNRNDVRTLISELCSSDLYISDEWKAIEERIMETVPQLLLPQILEEKVLGIIKPIGLEISMWMEDNHEYVNENLPAELCWTPQGTVDRKRTAEVLIRDKNLDMTSCYKLACVNCLEDDIHKFWEKLPKDIRECYSDEFSLISFWSSNRAMIKLGIAQISYTDEFALCAYEWSNKVAAEYFLQKLTPQEREESLVETAKIVVDADILCFLLSEMNEQQQIEVFKHKSYRVLECFLKWPLQSFFIGIANRMWDFLSKYDYRNILSEIIHEVGSFYKDYNYQKLFREFWQKSPDALKSFITSEMDKGDILWSLFRIKDKEIIRLILMNASPTGKEKLIYSDHVNTYCERSIRYNEWDFLEIFIRECFQSKNEMLKFKVEFEKRMMQSNFKGRFATKKHKWDQLFHFSVDSILKYDKRCVEEGESTSSKRFHSLQ